LHPKQIVEARYGSYEVDKIPKPEYSETPPEYTSVPVLGRYHLKPGK